MIIGLLVGMLLLVAIQLSGPVLAQPGAAASPRRGQPEEGTARFAVIGE
jgi:hypothetical protein